MPGTEGSVFVILMLLFVAPFVLGSYAAVQTFSERAQVRYFGFATAFFVVVLLIGAAVLLTNPV